MLGAIFSLKTLAALVDVFIVAVVLYYLMLMVKGTRAEKMLWGLAVIVIVYFVSLRAELVTLHWILSNFLGSIAIFVIVVFQQDIRRALVHMGRAFISRDVVKSRRVLEEIAAAVTELSRKKTGGLIAIERGVELIALLDTGVELDALVSRELLLSIFETSTPMHDGAVVIRGGRLYKAGCILPLTEKELGGGMGTRHRAALGLAEESDAVIIVVSEQTGEITLAVDEELNSRVRPEELLDRLRALFPYNGEERRTILPWKAGA